MLCDDSVLNIKSIKSNTMLHTNKTGLNNMTFNKAIYKSYSHFQITKQHFTFYIPIHFSDTIIQLKVPPYNHKSI